MYKRQLKKRKPKRNALMHIASRTSERLVKSNQRQEEGIMLQAEMFFVNKDIEIQIVGNDMMAFSTLKDMHG